MAIDGKIVSGDNIGNRERTSDTRLSSPKNVLNILPVVERRPLNGRVIGTKSPEIPPMVRKIIGETANQGDRLEVVAEAFDVSRSSVARARREHSELKDDIDKEIHNLAVDRIAGMFESCLIPEHIAKMEPKDATKAMKDLAKVAETFGGKKGNVFNGPTIVIYSPSMHTEEDYDVIDIEAKELK